MMRQAIWRSGEPAELPVSFEQAAVHLKYAVDETDIPDDILVMKAEIDAMISAVADILGGEAGLLERALVAAEWTQAQDCWSDDGGLAVALEMSPVISVSSVQYRDLAGAVVSLVEDDDFTLHRRGRSRFYLMPVAGNWPAVGDYPDAIQIKFQAGYAQEADKLPDGLRALVFLMLTHLWENRGAIVTGTIAASVPLSAQALINLYRRGMP